MPGGMMAGTYHGLLKVTWNRFSGTVSSFTPNGSAATFTMTPAADSAFTSMTGTTSMNVFQQSGTTLSGLTSIANGAGVQVRGLLFQDAGTWKLVASRITAPCDSLDTVHRAGRPTVAANSDPAESSMTPAPVVAAE